MILVTKKIQLQIRFERKRNQYD